jgi:CRP-like cAMP-binding protein
MERIFAQNQEQLTSYMADTPAQRYQKLVSQNPALLQMVPQYQIASYIGVRPESLSRIRRRLASGNSSTQ